MKNAIVKFSLTALAAFTLAACGSSGGSSDNTAAPSNEQKYYLGAFGAERK